MNTARPEEEILWYQAPDAILKDPNRLNAYYFILDGINSDLDNPIEFIFCPITNTINFAGKTSALLKYTGALRAAGFKLRDKPSGDALDPLQREEFIQMILQGGSYSG